jgi:hypothetical protein
VYQRTSHVLYGRFSGLNPSPVVVAEWRILAQDVETVFAT